MKSETALSGDLFPITVDARFLYASGIGNYLRNMLHELGALEPGMRFTLLVRELDHQAAVRDFPAATVQVCALTPLGIKNLIGSFVPPSTLLWVPHFNFPVFYRGRTAVTLHDISIRHRWMKPGLAAYFYSRLVFPFLASRAGVIACDSEATRRDFFAHYSRRNHVYTIHPGLEAQAAAPPARPRPGPYILAIGNVKPHKNLQNLVRAFRMLENEVSHDLVIIGRIEGLRTVDRTLLELAAGDRRIILAGAVSPSELAAYLAHAALFVFPSLFEGFGFPPLEAMAAGIPLAASDIPVVREVCGDVPVYFNPRSPGEMAQTMKSILSDSARASQMREAGPKRAASFEWRPAAERMAAVLRQAAFEDRRTGPSLDFVRACMKSKAHSLKRGRHVTKPRVSIVTIVLNAASTVEDTIRSVLSQTYGDVEYIVIDGGSKDGTQAIVEKYIERLSLYGTVSDSGISDAMNQALSLASGDIIGIIHADDWYEPDAVLQSLAALDNDPDAGYVCASLQYWKDGKRDAVFPSKPAALGIDMTVNHATCFVRKSVYQSAGLFKAEYPVAMDYEFFLRLKGLGIKGISLDCVTANMRYGGTSDRRWARGLFEMRRAQREIYGMHPRFLLAFPWRLFRAFAGRMLDRPLFAPFVRFYRSRLSGFKRSYKNAG